jgi:uncharacterized protein (TIGR01777 family)
LTGEQGDDSMKIAITGATGFVGSRLVERLHAEGHQILVFTRDLVKAQRVFPQSAYPNLEILVYTPTVSGPWQDAICGCDGVVNLAGTPIAEERWTPARKREIMESRQVTTEKLVEAIVKANPKPSVFVSGSAIGYYGTSETVTFEESSRPGDDFLADVCKTWESAAEPVKTVGTRLIIFRLGIVLAIGGAIRKILPAFKLFAGGPIGSGKQWFSWIHRDDAVNLIIYALSETSMEGVYNATAPNPVKMAEFSHVLGEVLNRPAWLPVPAIALELMLGDASKVVLEGQEVLPKRTLTSGFKFEYPKLKEALEQIFSTPY